MVLRNFLVLDSSHLQYVLCSTLPLLGVNLHTLDIYFLSFLCLLGSIHLICLIVYYYPSNCDTHGAMCLSLLSMVLRVGFLFFSLLTWYYRIYCYCLCASSGLHYFTWCTYTLLDVLFCFYLCWCLVRHSIPLLCILLTFLFGVFTLFALFIFVCMLPAPLLYCIRDVTGHSPCCLFSLSAAHFRCGHLPFCGFVMYSSFSVLFLLLHPFHFLGPRQCSLCFFLFYSDIISCSLFVVDFPTCLCVSLYSTRLWMCHCSLGPFLLRPAVAGSGHSRSALGLAGIVAFSSSLTSVLSRHSSGIPLGRIKNSVWTEWKRIFYTLKRYPATEPPYLSPLLFFSLSDASIPDALPVRVVHLEWGFTCRQRRCQIGRDMAALTDCQQVF